MGNEGVGPLFITSQSFLDTSLIDMVIRLAPSNIGGKCHQGGILGFLGSFD